MNHTRRATVAIMARLALVDGNVSDEEFDLLSEWVPKEDLPELFRSVADKPITDLVRGIESYQDRFFIALRAYIIAHEDLDFDESEKAFYQELIDIMQISDDDQLLIKNTALGRGEPDPRLETLYMDSSFYKEEKL